MITKIELRPLREQVQEMTTVYEEKKQVYDRTSATLDSAAAKLEQVKYWLQIYN